MMENITMTDQNQNQTPTFEIPQLENLPNEDLSREDLSAQFTTFFGQN